MEVDYITILPLLFTLIHFGRIYRQKRIFLYCFMHKNWKTTKYIFWLQKVVKSWIWWHFQIRDQKLVYISFLLFLEHERFIPLVGGGKGQGILVTFCPPPVRNKDFSAHIIWHVERFFFFLLKSDSSEQRLLNFFCLDLHVQMRWYLDWSNMLSKYWHWGHCR